MQYRADFKAVPACLVEASETFKVVCAWCKKVMRDGRTEKISHGICLSCVEIVLERGGHEDSKTDSGTISGRCRAKN